MSETWLALPISWKTCEAVTNFGEVESQLLHYVLKINTLLYLNYMVENKVDMRGGLQKERITLLIVAYAKIWTGDSACSACVLYLVFLFRDHAHDSSRSCDLCIHKASKIC